MTRWKKGLLAAAVLGVLAAGAGRYWMGSRSGPSGPAATGGPGAAAPVSGASAAAAATAARAASGTRAGTIFEFVPEDVLGAQMRELAIEVEFTGTVRPVRSALVKARVAGEVTRITVREGEAVKAGQVLVEQDPAELELRVKQAEQQVASARAQAEVAQRTLANNRALVGQGFISPTALESSISNEAAAQATVAAAEAAADIARRARGDAVLTAPIAGTISQRLAQPGERVSVDARILEIVDLSRLELEAALAPQDVAPVRVGRRATLQVEGLTEPVRARVARISPTAQAGSRTVPVYLELDPNPALRQGLFARGRIELQRRRVLALPLSAVRTDRPQPYVLKLDAERVVARTVALGERSEVDGVQWVEVSKGLAEGERVLAGSAGAVPEGSAWRMAAERR